MRKILEERIRMEADADAVKKASAAKAAREWELDHRQASTQERRQTMLLER